MSAYKQRHDDTAWYHPNPKRNRPLTYSNVPAGGLIELALENEFAMTTQALHERLTSGEFVCYQDAAAVTQAYIDAGYADALWIPIAGRGITIVDPHSKKDAAVVMRQLDRVARQHELRAMWHRAQLEYVRQAAEDAAGGKSK